VADLDIPRSTLNRALDELVAEGAVTKHDGAGKTGRAIGFTLNQSTVHIEEDPGYNHCNRVSEGDVHPDSVTAVTRGTPPGHNDFDTRPGQDGVEPEVIAVTSLPPYMDASIIPDADVLPQCLNEGEAGRQGGGHSMWSLPEDLGGQECLHGQDGHIEKFGHLNQNSFENPQETTMVGHLNAGRREGGEHAARPSRACSAVDGTHCRQFQTISGVPYRWV
jgi:hypothetical protein